MKKIHLIRHGKSSWGNVLQADIDRPLNKRGIKASRFMAQHIWDAGCRFKNVYCSPAVRAKSTIELINSSLREIDVKWEINEFIYGCSSASLLEWCRSLDESISELVVIGHNPTFTDFCNELSNSNIYNIPTCGYAQLTIKKDCPWQELVEGSAELTKFLRPKKLMN